MLGNAPAKSRDTFHGMLAAVQLSEATSTSRPQVEGCDEISAKGSPDPGLLGGVALFQLSQPNAMRQTAGRISLLHLHLS